MERKIDLTLTDAIGKTFKFETINQLTGFCSDELKGWSAANEMLPEGAKLSHGHTKTNHLQAILDTINSWKEDEPSWDEDAFTVSFQQLNKQHIKQLSVDWIWYGHAFVPKWIKLHTKAKASADAFVATILGKPPNSIGASVDHLIGYLLAYEYLMHGESEITERRNSEELSLNNLRDQLSVSHSSLIKEVDGFKEGFSDWDASTRKMHERLYSVRQKLGERQIKNQERKFLREMSAWRQSIGNLENTYADLLRLEKPAQYWRNSAKKYWRQGLLFSLLIVIFAGVGLTYFERFYVAWLQGQELGVSLNTIQGVVILGFIVAIYAFLIRVLSRLAFSSFHLMRDAEEREQLTYLYLSLSEKSSVDDDSRAIVLQALFSRTETGLLAQEHGPTMPGISDAIRYASKSRS